VSGKANQVRLVLDTYPLGSTGSYPTLEQPASHVAYLHFYEDYGFYRGSVKYIYDLASQRPAAEDPLRNPRPHLLGAAERQAALQRVVRRVRASRDDHDRTRFGRCGARLQHRGRSNSARLRRGTGAARYNRWPVRTYREPDAARPAPPTLAYRVIDKSGKKQSYPAPVPTMALHRELLPGKQAPGEIENGIGPFVLDGNRIWFANTFYDSEGVSGVGAIGSFDLSTRRYEMRYLPEIAPWSGSAILLDGADLWIGLMRRPEGADYGAGLLRYNISTGAVAKYPVADYIHTIDRLGDTLYCGTSHGLYTVRAATSRNCASSPTTKESSSWCRARCGRLQFLVDDRPDGRQVQRAVVFPAIDEDRGRALHARAVAVFHVARHGLLGYRRIEVRLEALHIESDGAGHGQDQGRDNSRR